MNPTLLLFTIVLQMLLLTNKISETNSLTAPSSSNFPTNPTMSSLSEEINHDEITIQLAKKESAHHYHGMEELKRKMETRELQVKAFAIDDDNAPSVDSTSDQGIIKIIHFVRHGQGFHNLLADIYSSQGKEWTQFKREDDNPYVRMELLDAPLTDKGRKQAKALQSQIESMEPLEIVLLSTNCRALQTGIITFQSYVNKIPFIAHEMIREEIGVHLCDQRRSISSHKLEFPMVNFDLVPSDEDILFQYDKRESKMDVGERIYSFLEWLEKRDEKHIGVTSHSGWLFTLFNGIVDCDDKLRLWFHTGEMRSVKLVFTRDAKKGLLSNN